MKFYHLYKWSNFEHATFSICWNKLLQTLTVFRWSCLTKNFWWGSLRHFTESGKKTHKEFYRSSDFNIRETLRFSLDKFLKISKENLVVASQSYKKARKKEKRPRKNLLIKLLNLWIKYTHMKLTLYSNLYWFKEIFVVI